MAVPNGGVDKAGMSQRVLCLTQDDKARTMKIRRISVTFYTKTSLGIVDRDLRLSSQHKMAAGLSSLSSNSSSTETAHSNKS